MQLATNYRFHPALMLKIPSDSFTQSRFQGVGGTPAEFDTDLRRIHRVTPIMAGAVWNKGDEAARMTTQLGLLFVNEITDHLHEMHVRQLVPTADIVGLPDFTAGENGPECFAMISHIKPVAHVHPIAVNRNRLAGEDALNDHGNEFLRKLIGTEIVRTACNDGRETVGVVVTAHEHVARGFAGGIGRVRRTGSGLGESGIMGTEGAENFVGGDVKKSTGSILDASCWIEPMGAAGFEEVEGAVDVGGDEVARTGDAAINM